MDNLAMINIGQYISASVVAALITACGIAVNAWTQRRQRAIDAEQKEQDKGQDNSAYWEGQTQSMRKELALLKAETAETKARHDREIAFLGATNERQAREIVLLKTQVYDLRELATEVRSTTTRVGKEEKRNDWSEEATRQQDDRIKRIEDRERQTTEGKRLDKMRNDMEDENG